MAAQLPADLTATVWRDDTFFAQFPLNLHTVLDYFSRSPFYVPNCNNEECKRQGLPESALRNMGPGIEFVVTYAAEPVLYVIKRQLRTSAQDATQQAFYYVQYGNVYQAPSVHACLTARTARCLHHVETAFAQLRTDLEPLAWRARVRAKRLKRSQGRAGAAQRAADASDHDRMDTASPPAASAQTHASVTGDTVEGAAGATAEGASAAAAADALDREAAQGVAQQQRMTVQRYQWIQQTDNVIENVLGRYEVPMYKPHEEQAAADQGAKPE